MRRCVERFAVVALVALVAGCGSSSSSTSSSSRTAAAPAPSAFAGNYDEAKVVCGVKSRRSVAVDLGLPVAASAERVAARYARGYSPAARRAQAYRGCLAGMRGRGR